MPLQTAYLTVVYKNNGYFYGGGNSKAFTYAAYDTPDSAGDSTTVLGDVASDRFASVGASTGTPTTPNATYIGKTADGFIGQYQDGTYILYSNHAYGTYGKISSFVADQPGDPSTYTTVCFGEGTPIATPNGTIAVERLTVGDIVVTASGLHRPIRWLGHRRIDCRRHPRPAEVMPVRIAANAFGEGRPARDLYVSPAHAICVDLLGEVLIPAGALLNGSTIVQVEVDTVTYWHVELDSHDILLAENLPAESYIDCGNRSFFIEATVTTLDVSPRTRPAIFEENSSSPPASERSFRLASHG